MSALQSTAIMPFDVGGDGGESLKYRTPCVSLACVLIACTQPRDVSPKDTAGAPDGTAVALAAADPPITDRIELILTSKDVDAAPCGLPLDPEPGLANATRIAAGRWSAATGCDIRVEGGGAPIVFVEQPRLADGTPKRAVTIRSVAGLLERIEYRRSGFLEHTAEALLAHEIAHALGMRDHTATGIGAERVMLNAAIDTATLDAVCAGFPCASFSPEM